MQLSNDRVKWFCEKLSERLATHYVSYDDRDRSHGIESYDNPNVKSDLVSDIDNHRNLPYTYFNLAGHIAVLAMEHELVDAWSEKWVAASAYTLAQELIGIPVKLLHNENSAVALAAVDWFVSYDQWPSESDLIPIADMYEERLVNPPWVDEPSFE